MIKYLKNGVLFNLILVTVTILSVRELDAAQRKSYSKKAPYVGYGKPSEVNGLPKTKVTTGHVKKTSKGYTYVNPYARSK